MSTRELPYQQEWICDEIAKHRMCMCMLEGERVFDSNGPKKCVKLNILHVITFVFPFINGVLCI